MHENHTDQLKYNNINYCVSLCLNHNNKFYLVNMMCLSIFEDRLTTNRKQIVARDSRMEPIKLYPDT